MIRTVSGLPGPNWTYPAAAQTADFGTARIRVHGQRLPALGAVRAGAGGEGDCTFVKGRCQAEHLR